MLGGLVGHDSCCCSSVSEPVLTAVFCNGLMWHKLCFLRASVRNVRPLRRCAGRACWARFLLLFECFGTGPHSCFLQWADVAYALFF